MQQWLEKLQAATGRVASSSVQYSPAAPPQSSSTPVPVEQEAPQQQSPPEPAPKAKKGGFFSKGRKS